MRKKWSFVRSDHQRELVGVVTAHHCEPDVIAVPTSSATAGNCAAMLRDRLIRPSRATCSPLTVFDGVTSIVMASSVWSLYAPAGN